MEWQAPAIVLAVRPFGENDAIANVFAEEHGAFRGLARGGGGRRGAALWQRGNLLSVRWVGRLAEQLGSFSAEMMHPIAALAMADPLQLAMLDAMIAVADGALPDRQPHPEIFKGLLSLLTHLADGSALLPELVGFEVRLLADLGYGLDLSRCAASGARKGLAFVSPKSGRAVSEAAAGPWRERLLKLPPFLLGPVPSDPADWRDGLRLTGHFLARDVFALHHKPLPPPRLLLYDRVAAMAKAMESTCPTQ